jgi:hypothetical protein
LCTIFEHNLNKYKLQKHFISIDNLLRLNIQPCKTSVDITTLLESCMNEHEKESVVKAQITYFAIQRFCYLSTLVWPRCVQ